MRMMTITPLAPAGRSLTGFYLSFAVAILGVLASADSLAQDTRKPPTVQVRTKSSPAAGSALQNPSSTETKNSEKAPKTKIRTRSPQPDYPSPSAPEMPENVPSIDPDAQKGLVDRMKGCCGPPRN